MEIPLMKIILYCYFAIDLFASFGLCINITIHLCHPITTIYTVLYRIFFLPKLWFRFLTVILIVGCWTHTHIIICICIKYSQFSHIHCKWHLHLTIVNRWALSIYYMQKWWLVTCVKHSNAMWYENRIFIAIIIIIIEIAIGMEFLYCYIFQ